MFSLLATSSSTLRLVRTDTFTATKPPLSLLKVNILGAAFMSTVNGLANWLNSFPVLSPALQSGYGVYPGDVWCNPQEPHSKWHVESANGLMDLMLLADSVYKMTL